jgi:hypothetical protein
MAFAVRNLSVLAYAQGFTLWHYKAGAEKLSHVARSGFFNQAADMFAPGDMLMVSAAEGGRMFFVTATGDAVTTASMS